MALKYYGQYIDCDTETDVMALVGKLGDVAYAENTGMRYAYTGAGWFPTDALRVIRGTGTVNMLSAASTKILTINPTSFRFIVLGAHIEVLSLTGTVITQPTLSIGTNATNYNNLFSANILNGVLTTVGLTSTNSLSLASAVPALTGSTDIYAKVSLGAIGATVYTARIDLMGYFEV